MTLPPLPASFPATREALRAVACYVLGPARKARTGRIGLRPTGDGFGTPPFDDGSRLLVRGDRLIHDPAGDSIALTSVRTAAAFAGVEPSPDPGVGDDLPPYTPDADLGIDPGASFALGAWYAAGQRILDQLTARSPAAGVVSDAQLWPEHFDLAVVVDLPGGARVNVGFSPGDSFSTLPYTYVGPHDTTALPDAAGYWNAPFGAFLDYAALQAASDPEAAATAFIAEGLAALTPADGAGRGD